MSRRSFLSRAIAALAGLVGVKAAPSLSAPAGGYGPCTITLAAAAPHYEALPGTMYRDSIEMLYYVRDGYEWIPLAIDEEPK